MAPVFALRSLDGDEAGDDVRGVTITAAMERYLDARIGRGELTPESAKKVRNAVKQLVKAVGDKPIRKLGKADAEQWLAVVAHKQVSTRRLNWSCLRVFCEWCVDEELLVRNPFRQVKPPKPQRRPPRDLPREAVGKLLVAAERADGLRGKVIVLLMVQQGLRCGGVAGLRVEDVDLAARWMRVVEKGGHERSLWITDECHEALVAYLSEHPVYEPGPLVRAWKHPGQRCAGLGPHLNVATERGLDAGTISKWVTGWMYDAGIKRHARDGVTPHALRHTCATNMLDAGADIMDVRAALGHSSVSTTMIYTAVRPQRLPGAMGGRRYGEGVA